MAEIVYTAEEQSWYGTLETELFEGTAIYVHTHGSEDPPSTTQLRAVELAESLGTEFRQTVEDLLRKWVELAWEPDAQSDLEPEDFEYEFGSVEVPHIKSLNTPFFMIRISCELEPEHGVGIACRGGETFAVCHPESYHNLDMDDESVLNEPFDNSETAG